MFGGDGSLGGGHGFADVGNGVDSSITASEQRGECGRASGSQKAGCGSAEGGHCGWWSGWM